MSIVQGAPNTGWITRDEYDKKLKKYKEKQHDTTLRLEELTNAWDAEIKKLMVQNVLI